MKPTSQHTMPPANSEQTQIKTAPTTLQPPPQFPLNELNHSLAEQQHQGEDLMPVSREFRFISAQDTMVKPIEWLIDQVIEANSHAMIYGIPGHGKSFVAFDMASCIASGRPFHGRKVKQGAVFYIAGEGHKGLARRLHAWSKKNCTPPPSNLFISETSLDLLQIKNTHHLCMLIQEIVDATGIPPALIIVDTLARNFSGDENSAKDMGRIIKNIDYARQQWNASAMIIHHTSKGGRGPRGSTALPGAIDAEYEVKIINNLINFTTLKLREGVLPPPMQFELVSVPVRDNTGGVVESAALQLIAQAAPTPEPKPLGHKQTLALDMLKEMLAPISAQNPGQEQAIQQTGVPLRDWKAKCAAAGIPRNRMKEVVDTLQTRCCIEIDGAHVRLSGGVRSVRPLYEGADTSDAPTPSSTARTTSESLTKSAEVLSPASSELLAGVAKLLGVQPMDLLCNGYIDEHDLIEMSEISPKHIAEMIQTNPNWINRTTKQSKPSKNSNKPDLA